MTFFLFSFAFEFQSRHFSFSCFFFKTFEFHEFHDFTLKTKKNWKYLIRVTMVAMHICEAVVVFLDHPQLLVLLYM